MLLNFIYDVLQAIANAIYATVATIWQIEQTLINFMMSSFLFVLGLACHPIMVIPMLMGCFYILRNFWYRRVKNPRVENAADGVRHVPLSPRLPPYRNFGNLSALNNDSPKEN
ncbi:uncharacterized protein LOC108095196 [Drosophila ficusphila]|uniref:uncharacterized protein LOC108095196 n=1 Tax=Drosophila ficusphila TaxID=30025 RepID=UPI0007E8115D|nr:uncharacterized protein LOC108095196 [Drosophila ficusphila]